MPATKPYNAKCKCVQSWKDWRTEGPDKVEREAFQTLFKDTLDRVNPLDPKENIRRGLRLEAKIWDVTFSHYHSLSNPSYREKCELLPQLIHIIEGHEKFNKKEDEEDKNSHLLRRLLKQVGQDVGMWGLNRLGLIFQNEMTEEEWEQLMEEKRRCLMPVQDPVDVQVDEYFYDDVADLVKVQNDESTHDKVPDPVKVQVDDFHDEVADSVEIQVDEYFYDEVPDPVKVQNDESTQDQVQDPVQVQNDESTQDQVQDPVKVQVDEFADSVVPPKDKEEKRISLFPVFSFPMEVDESSEGQIADPVEPPKDKEETDAEFEAKGQVAVTVKEEDDDDIELIVIKRKHRDPPKCGPATFFVDLTKD